MAKIIAICNQKGGTGKTTTAVNLATSLALAGKQILVVDIDPQGNATSGLGVDKKQVKESIYHSLLGNKPLSDVEIDSAIANLKVIPSSIDLSAIEIELINTENREFRLQSCIEPQRSKFDYIFIDCPPSLGLITINALVAADSVIIPIQCEYYALEGVSLILKTINLVQDRLNPHLEIEGVVLTMADFRTNLTNDVINEIRAFFKERVYQTIIPRNIRLSEAPGFGKPIFLYDKSSVGAKRYQELANELLGLPISSQASEVEEVSVQVQESTGGSNG
ncbi:ParA family protein [Candidatus Omnitrophota bacterium]